MYARNNANPLPMLVGTITQISDGVVQTAGVSVNVSKDNGAYVAGANTPTVEQGEWSYTPSQAETDCSSLRVVIYKTGCYSRSIQVVFTASESFGYAGTDQSKITNAMATVALANTSIKSVTDETIANVTKIAGQTASASAPVSFPASVANETTVANRATQTSVNAIPTNPLLTTDTRLNNLNAPIGSIPTNPLLTTDTRLNNLNAPIGSIPTNPLLTTDARLNFLDASIATSTSSILGAITGLNNLSAKANLFGAAVLEAPETGSSIYEFTLVVNDDEGKLVNLDTAPTITATNSSGTNRSTNLSAVTNPSVGRYRFTYTVSSTHPREGLQIEASGTTSTEARYAIWAGAVVDFDQSTVLAQIVSDLSLKPTLVQIEASTILAKELTVANRASQTSVDALPNTTRNLVMNSMPGGGWANGSFGDRWIISNNSNRTIGVTGSGSGHVHAVIHGAETGVFVPTTFTTAVYDTITTNLLATSHSSYTTPGTVGKTLTDTNTGVSSLLTRIPAATAQLVVDLATMLLGSNSPLVRWTAQALSLAPAGGGGGGGQTSVTPEAFINLDNKLLEKNTFVFFNNETRTYLVTLASGVFDGLPMTFCLERTDKSTLTAVTGLTSTTNAVSVTIPSITPQTDNCLHWSLRDSATGRIILYGPAIQKYAAFNN
jgi:hypothetical protein